MDDRLVTQNPDLAVLGHESATDGRLVAQKGASPVPFDPTAQSAWPAWIALVRAQVQDRPSGERADAGRAVGAALLRVIAHAEGWDPDVHGLLLLDGADEHDLPPPPPALLGPDLLGAVHEALMDPDGRRATGAHYTPAPVASALVEWALEGWQPRSLAPRTVDLAVGGGAFLLAVARWALARGGVVPEVLGALGGVDADPVAVAVAEASLVVWARAEGWDGSGPGPSLGAGDGTEVDAVGPSGALSMGGVDLVVGNPPFLGQMGTGTTRSRSTAARLRARYGSEVSGYVDDAAVFLRVACEWPRSGGRVVLVQPESILGARDAEGVRAAVGERADLIGLWVAGEAVFAAAVDVCAPVLQLRPTGAGPTGGPVARAQGVAVRPHGSDPRPDGASWAPLLARSRGVPAVTLDPGTGTLGDMATATAGFRQHFYALAPHLSEIPDGVDPASIDPDVVPVLTTGLVDPLTLRWGSRPARIAGSSWRRPGVDLRAVAADDATVAAWVRARLRPKVVVASQTRVVEAAVDGAGGFVPGVPLVSVEPLDDGAPGGPEEVLWLVVAALSAPPVTAWAMTRAAGTARHRDAMRLSARQVLGVPLPSDRAGWATAASELRAGRALAEVGPELTQAYGVEVDHPVTTWWRARLPRTAP